MAIDGRSETRPALTEDEAERQINALKRLYDEGYLGRVQFEAMKSHLLARSRGPDRVP